MKKSFIDRYYRQLIVLHFVILICLGLCIRMVRGDDPGRQPEGQLRLPCKIVDVYDGDTVTVEVTIPIRVRLIDCWAPEVTGDEKERGLVSRDHLREIALDQKGLLVIPIGRSFRTFGDLFSFDRAIGWVFIGHPQRDLSELQIKAGQATKTRNGKGE